MMRIAVAAVVLFSQLGSATPDVVVARPKVPNIVHVGQTLVVPLCDGEIGPGWYGFAPGVTLRLRQYKYRCVSCRTVNFYYCTR